MDALVAGRGVEFPLQTVGGDSLCNLKSMRAPILEDGKKTASAVRRALQVEGFVADVCGNGDEALAAKRKAFPRIFDCCCRGVRAHTNDVEGCGLGFSIAQWIVSAHNGTIQIESTPGQLTAVIVRLPLSS